MLHIIDHQQIIMESVNSEENPDIKSEFGNKKSSNSVRESSAKRIDFSSYVDEMKPNEFLNQFVISLQGEVPKFRCSFCKHESDRKTNLKNHILTHVTLPPRFKCLECHFEDDRRHIMRRHILEHLEKDKKEKCPICGVYLSDDKTSLTHLIKHIGKVLNCHQCDFETKSRHSYVQHLSLHKSNFFYTCDKCNFITPLEQQFESHKLNHISTSKLYSCKMCQYETNWRQSLDRHLVTHSRVKLFKCENCDYETNRKEYLNFHKLKHYSHTKLYSCELCNYQTNWKHSLNRHCITHERKAKIAELARKAVQ